jgi:large-conductance mechanosensitive channel
MDLKKEIVKFIDDNKIVGYTSGLVVALVTKDLILSLVADLVLPLILIVLMKFKFKFATDILDAKHKGTLNITKFISSLVTWVLGIIITYLFVQYAFVKFLGAKYATKSDGQTKSKEISFDDSAAASMMLF